MHNAEWRIGEIDFSKLPFHPRSLEDILLVIDNANGTAKSILGYDLERCRESYWYNHNFLSTEGHFIKPVVLIRTPDNYVTVLDGNHRLAALFSLGANNFKGLQWWLGV
ncbi:MAG: hypothetical protein DRQ52_06970 [Gammaproteobacteria bacterium]|nr:MAG: hypothetical protein DRQ52_06970 [Gammaproteobacteria bacterium]